MQLVVRLSPGSEPVVEIHTDNLAQLDASLRSMRSEGVWSALKGAAREFADAPLAGIEAAVTDPVAVIQQALPGAQVIADGATPVEPEPQVDLAAEKAQLDEWNRLAQERAIEKGQLDPADVEMPKATTARCKTCGAATTPGSGKNAKGVEWEALFCSSGERSHTTFTTK